MIKIGQMGKDSITGFKGLAMGRAEYLTGCTQILLTPTALDKDGKRRDGEWFDEQRIVADGKKVINLDNARTPGVDEREAPKR